MYTVSHNTTIANLNESQYFSDIDSEEETRLRITPFSSPKSGTVATKNERTGLNSPIAMSLMILWYIFSACNLFMNKYVISYLNGEPALLGIIKFLLIFEFMLIYFFSNLSNGANADVYSIWIYPDQTFMWSVCQSPIKYFTIYSKWLQIYATINNNLRNSKVILLQLFHSTIPLSLGLINFS